MSRAVAYTVICANIASDGEFIGGKIVSLRALTAQGARDEAEKERGVKAIVVVQGNPMMPWRRG